MFSEIFMTMQIKQFVYAIRGLRLSGYLVLSLAAKGK